MNFCRSIKWIFSICCSLFLLSAAAGLSVSAAETETVTLTADGSAAAEDGGTSSDTSPQETGETAQDSSAAAASGTEESASGAAEDSSAASASETEESTSGAAEETGSVQDAAEVSDTEASAEAAASEIATEETSDACCATEEEKAAAFTTAANFNAPIYTDPETGITYTQTFSGETITVCGASFESALAADDPEEYVAILKAQTSSFYWEGTCLNEYDGVNRGPSGKETWYNLNMSTIVSVLHSKGYEGEYWIRSDGVKMFGRYILCAADYSTYSYGTIVETSLGTGIIADTGCARGVVDIAVAW